GDLVGYQPEPGMPFVVDHLVTTDVLAGEQPFHLGQTGVRLSHPWHLADRFHRAGDLDAAELQILGARIHQYRDPWIGREILPARTARNGVQPDRAVVPAKPQRCDVRTTRVDGSVAAGHLAVQELVDLVPAHGDTPAATLCL